MAEVNRALGNGMADLHGGEFLLERFAGHARRTGGRAVNAVAPGLAADQQRRSRRAAARP